MTWRLYKNYFLFYWVGCTAIKFRDFHLLTASFRLGSLKSFESTAIFLTVYFDIKVKDHFRHPFLASVHCALRCRKWFCHWIKNIWLKNMAVSEFPFGQESVARAQLDFWIFAIKLETLNCIIFYQEESHYFFVS